MSTSHVVQGMLTGLTQCRSYDNAFGSAVEANIPLQAGDRVAVFFPTVGTNFKVSPLNPFPPTAVTAGGVPMDVSQVYRNPAAIDLVDWFTSGFDTLYIFATDALELGVLIYK